MITISCLLLFTVAVILGIIALRQMDRAVHGWNTVIYAILCVVTVAASLSEYAIRSLPPDAATQERGIQTGFWIVFLSGIGLVRVLWEIVEARPAWTCRKALAFFALALVSLAGAVAGMYRLSIAA